MTSAEKKTPPKKVRYWPGMPTPRSQFFEFFLGFFPTWIGVFGISMALLLPLVQSCREWARNDTAQAPPQSAANSDP